jgi:hypothetical protein
MLTTYTAAALLTGVAGLTTPYGAGLYSHLFDYLSDAELLSAVAEFAPPDFHHVGGRMIEVLLFLSLVAAGNAVRRRRFVEPLLVLTWSHLSLQSERHVPLAAVIVLPIAAHEWTLLLRELLDALPAGRALAAVCGRFRWRRAGLIEVDRQLNDAAIVLVMCLATGILLIDPAVRRRLVVDHFSPRQFPVDAATVAARGLEEERIGGRVYSSDRFGGYLIYRFRGAVKVFVDGRSDFYRQGPVLDDFARIRAVKPEWAALLERYGIGWMLLTPGEALETVALQSGRWRREYSDAAASLLVRVR